MAEFIERGYLRAHMTRVVREYRRRRDAFGEALTRYLPRECSFSLPRHGLVLFVSAPVPPDELYEACFRERVLVSPSPMWSPDARTRPGLRLAYCAEPPERLVEGAKRLGKAIRGMMARTARSADPAPGGAELV